LYRDPTAARGTKGPRKKPPGRPKLSEEEKKRRKELREARMKQAALEEELRKNG
jgi:hypothetical protein